MNAHGEEDLKKKRLKIDFGEGRIALSVPLRSTVADACLEAERTLGSDKLGKRKIRTFALPDQIELGTGEAIADVVGDELLHVVFVEGIRFRPPLLPAALGALDGSMGGAGATGPVGAAASHRPLRHPDANGTDEEYWGSWNAALQKLQFADDQAVIEGIVSHAASQGWQCTRTITRTDRNSGGKEYVFVCGTMQEHKQKHADRCCWRLLMRREGQGTAWLPIRPAQNNNSGKGTHMKHRNGSKDGRDCLPAKPVLHKAVPVKAELFAKVGRQRSSEWSGVDEICSALLCSFLRSAPLVSSRLLSPY